MADLRINSHPSATVPSSPVVKSAKTGFSDVMKASIDQINKTDVSADQSVTNLLSGKASINETMLALQKADVSMRLVMAVRNKVIDVYREIMHMQF
jgi:flagellar hook-basal body complex protein FliE